VIGTLAVDEWAVTFGTARRGLGGQLHIIQCGTVGLITFTLQRFKSVNFNISTTKHIFSLLKIIPNSKTKAGELSYPSFIKLKMQLNVL